MKKVLQLLVVPAFLMGVTVWSFGASASAIPCDDVTISNTGPSSENRILCQDETSITIQCSNNTIVTIDINQDAGSGDAEVEGNTNGGNANSGDANNNSEVEVDVNNVCGDTSTEETPEQPTTPVTPASTTTTTPTDAAPVSKPTVKSLPNTGEVSPVVIAGALLVAVASTMIVARTVLSRR